MSGFAFLSVLFLGIASFRAAAHQSGPSVPVFLAAAAAALVLEGIRIRRSGRLPVSEAVRALARTIILGLVVSAGAASVGVVAAAIGGAPEVAHKMICLAKVKTVTAAMEMYLADNDGAFPSADTWCDTVGSYLQTGTDKHVFECPSVPELRCGYAYNAALSGMRRDDLSDRANTILLFESDKGWNAADGSDILPNAPRHLGGDNGSFADGHARWLSRATVIPGEMRSGWLKAYRRDDHIRWKP